MLNQHANKTRVPVLKMRLKQRYEIAVFQVFAADRSLIHL
jgi:hypothetical protein